MTRHRARPSFTVEVKRTRNTPIIPQDETDRHRAAAEALWKGTTLAEMTAKAESFDAVFAPRAVTAPVRAKAVLPERRVLPSLIPAPEPAEPEAREEPVFVPVVRRRRSPAARPRMLTLVDDAALEEETEAMAVSSASPAPVPPPVESAPSEVADGVQRSGRTYVARSKDALRPGERWKRRLPRVLW